MAEAMDLCLFLCTESDSSDNPQVLEPTFIPDYRDSIFTRSELNMLQMGVYEELASEDITAKQKIYLERLSDIVNEMIMEYHLSYFNINGEFPRDGFML